MKKVYLVVMVLSAFVILANELQGDGTTIAKEVIRIHEHVKRKPIGRAPSIVNWNE